MIVESCVWYASALLLSFHCHASIFAQAAFLAFWFPSLFLPFFLEELLYSSLVYGFFLPIQYFAAWANHFPAYIWWSIPPCLPFCCWQWPVQHEIHNFPPLILVTLRLRFCHFLHHYDQIPWQPFLRILWFWIKTFFQVRFFNQPLGIFISDSCQLGKFYSPIEK